MNSQEAVLTIKNLSFGYSKDNKYLLVALQDSDSIELYRVGESGIVEDKLIYTLKINTPVCVKTLK